MNARIDQILIRLGYATEEQIQQALQRQRTHGGKLGTHLLFFKSVTEEQLAEALSIQHEVPCFNRDEHVVSRELIGAFPVKLARKHLVLPISRDAETESVSIVVADPEDTHPVAAVKRVLNCPSVKKYVAPESVVRDLIDDEYRGDDTRTGGEKVIELPELFGESADVSEDEGDSTESSIVKSRDQSHILMVSRTAFLRNFLRPIFERDGYTLHVMWDPTEIEHALRTISFERILVSEEDEERFQEWLRRSNVPLLRTEIAGFTTVSGALLENPVPYQKIKRSLIRSLQVIAEIRNAKRAGTPPYDLICKDIENLARSVGLRRLAVDGLQIASLLLTPALGEEKSVDGSSVGGVVRFDEPDRSLDYARSLRFPWGIDEVMHPFLELMSGEKKVTELGVTSGEMQTAAQVLSIVWHRHLRSDYSTGSPGDTHSTARSLLRKQAGRLANSDVIEAYVRVLDEAKEKPYSSRHQQLFVIGAFDSVADQFATRLKHAGYRPVRIDDLAEARSMARRVTPTAILVHDESYPDDILACREAFQSNSPALLYAITQGNNPSRILDLFDAGFDDVFAPPFDFEIIAARIGKSIHGVSQADTVTIRPGGFRASFKAFAFTDLVQALQQSRKSVRITLAGEDNGQARVFMRDGRLVHAKCGRTEGAEAIYRIITWGEEGSFAVEPEDQFPLDNIVGPTEAILMEGCRLLDESNR